MGQNKRNESLFKKIIFKSVLSPYNRNYLELGRKELTSLK